jgi:glycosyltransferase involved in cell wall biosynthesis
MDGGGAVAVLRPASPTAVLFLYRDSPLRREALAAAPGTAVRYCLFGLDELRAGGFDVGHNLEHGPPGVAARAGGGALRTVVGVLGGNAGDVASVLAARAPIARADVVFATVDTVGIPLALLRRRRLVARTPVVYASIGLLERLARLRGARLRRSYLRALGEVDAVVAYGAAEADELRAWLGQLSSPPPVHFVPFGVDTALLAPDGRLADLDAVSVGADPQRDYGLLVEAAARTPEVAYAVVASSDQSGVLARAPANVTVQLNASFVASLDVLRRARVVVLPVRDNAYSGGTTVLLQALALGKPVVVSRTRAIADGYGLVDGETCRLVPPGDAAALAAAVRELLADDAAAAALGQRARAHAKRNLGWERYVAALGEILGETARRRQETA